MIEPIDDPHKAALAYIIKECVTLPLFRALQERCPALFLGGSPSGSKTQPLTYADGGLVTARSLELTQTKAEAILPKAKHRQYIIKGIRP